MHLPNERSSHPLVPPQITPFDFGDEPANVGEVSMVSCMVARGDLPMDIFWSLNGMPIVSGEHSFTVSRMNARTSSLNIDQLDDRHRGQYRCRVRNAAGSDEQQSELRVNGDCHDIKSSFYVYVSLLLSIIKSHPK